MVVWVDRCAVFIAASNSPALFVFLLVAVVAMITKRLKITEIKLGWIPAVWLDMVCHIGGDNLTKLFMPLAKRLTTELPKPPNLPRLTVVKMLPLAHWLGLLARLSCFNL